MRDRGAGEALRIDRVAQVLPVPLGGLVPARRPPSRARVWRRHQSATLAALALIAGGAGVWISVAPRAHWVSFEAHAVRVDDAMLTSVAAPPGATLRLFSGAATLALMPGGADIMRGGAVMSWNGSTTTGRCVLELETTRPTETCDFTLGSRHLASHDTFDEAASVWHRHYSDGVEVAITVAQGSQIIPLPFPLGR